MSEFKTPSLPKESWKAGNIQMSKWNNENEDKVMISYSLQKSFKHEEEWVNLKLSGLSLADLNKVELLIQEAKRDFYLKEKGGVD